jgi:hypothetical protein
MGTTASFGALAIYLFTRDIAKPSGFRLTGDDRDFVCSDKRPPAA